ncbi:MAG: carbohydrate binding family 9 domain-containing protein [Gemmatimonadetes bacterium]|nr:carbohydrate binding family 9 domain-containing protein [Gemmatimonadota bacterium]
MMPRWLMCAAIAAPLLAQDPQAARQRAVSTRVSTPPVLDGRDADPAWREARPMRGFLQFQPRVDTAPAFDTEFRVTHDQDHLFVFVRMFDDHPDSVMHALARRDVRGPSDQVKVIIDSYGDRRSGYQFAVNPDGVKRDYSIANDSDEDDTWNGVWDVATAVDSLGWTAEFRIPFSQLRFQSGRNPVFGFGIWRDLERRLERSSWPSYRPDRAGLASQLGELAGLDGLAPVRNLEAVPYVVTRSVHVPSGSAFARGHETTIGGDLKLGLTSNVTVDATVNPDFGQVEADPSVVNLTAFEQFFSERRPFFLEGTSLYQFRLNCYIVVDCDTNEGLFYSRRIGRSPGLLGLYGDASTSNATPIAAAAKITGRTAGGLSFGVLDAVTGRVGGANEMTVEPRSNYTIASARQDYRGGEGSVSAILTRVDRSLDPATRPYLHEDATAGGLAWRHRFSERRFEFNAQVAASRIEGSPQAISRTQRNGVHFFQQPDDDLAVDTTRGSLSGHMAQVKLGKYAGGITRFETSLLRQSAGFDVNDVGFLRRADILDWSTWAALSFRQGRGIYRWAQLNANHAQHWNTSGDRLEHSWNANGHMGLNNNWDLHLGGTFGRLGGSMCDRCTRGGPLLRYSPGFFPWAGFNTDARRVVSGGMFGNLAYTDEGQTERVSVSPYVAIRPSTRLQLNVSTGFTRGTDQTQWLGNFVSGGALHHTFARLTHRTISASLRVNYTVTPDLTFEFYGQPFVATGRYDQVRELSDRPEADAYADRFRPFVPPADVPLAFRVLQLRTNAVWRWEYLPGSTLFVVWSQGRDGADERAEPHAIRDDYDALFRQRPNNTLLLKVAHWLSR